ncbi:hypothetical protein D3C75_1122000 [compost metagenome]
MPAVSITPVLSKVIRLLVSVTLVAGVKVAVQLMLSLVLRPLSVPFCTVKSARVRPVTGSLKTMVTVLVSPMARLLSATTMVAVGRTVSTA